MELTQDDQDLTYNAQSKFKNHLITTTIITTESCASQAAAPIQSTQFMTAVDSLMHGNRAVYQNAISLCVCVGNCTGDCAKMNERGKMHGVLYKCQKQHTLSKGTGSQARVRVLRSINLCNPCDPNVETVALPLNFYLMLRLSRSLFCKKYICNRFMICKCIH